jgi:hypothetical protein
MNQINPEKLIAKVQRTFKKEISSLKSDFSPITRMVAILPKITFEDPSRLGDLLNEKFAFCLSSYPY